jgi:hypothetical protein
MISGVDVLDKNTLTLPLLTALDGRPRESFNEA